MAINLQKGEGSKFSIDGNEYYNTYASIARRADGLKFDVTIDGAVIFAEVLFSDFENGDNGNAAFTSPEELQTWVDENTADYLPYQRPFRIVSAATTNDTLVKTGKVLLHRLEVVNLVDGSIVYLKIYDTASLPTSGDTPILTIPVVAKSEDTPIIIVEDTMQFANGLGLRLTAAVADADETAVTANEVFIQLIYQ